MMQTVLFQQEEIWKEFAFNTWPQFWPDGKDGRFRPPFNEKGGNTWRVIAKPQSQFPKYQSRFQKLDEDAERVERHILVQLDLKQKHAAIKEAHTASVMSAAIVGFTVITIIFTPLSFLTSLFALPIDQFQQNQKEGKYATSYIGKWIATGEIASLAVTVAATLLACVYFLKLRLTWPEWIIVVARASLRNRFTSKVKNRDNSDVPPSIRKASVRYINREGGHGTTNPETNPKSSHLFQDLARKSPFWRARNQKGHNRDPEICE
ncbi:hypothetical protein F5X97DRAFT_335768 [Nemania serpens]|nr:hypothetical protein F5X97DRAFT_335768 [Nemania serpens]